MRDYNQRLEFDDAVVRLRALEGLGLRWVEEPLVAGDVPGCRRLAARTSIPIQVGESWWIPDEAARSILARASRLVMLDVARIGGVTGWLLAGASARATGLPVSSHTVPEFSVQLLAATPTADLVEWPGSAGPLNATPVRVENGRVHVPQGAGAGITWDEDAVARHLVPGAN